MKKIDAQSTTTEVIVELKLVCTRETLAHLVENWDCSKVTLCSVNMAGLKPVQIVQLQNNSILPIFKEGAKLWLPNCVMQVAKEVPDDDSESD